MKKFSSFIISICVINIVSAQTAGTLDSTFGHNGIISKSIGLSGAQFDKMGVQLNGDIIAAGMNQTLKPSTYVIVYCFHQNGTLNENFGANGSVVIDDSSNIFYLGDLLILPDYKILILVNKLNQQYFTEEFQLYRFLADGTLDDSFGPDGIVHIIAPGGISVAPALQLQDDKILLLASLTSETTDGGIIYRFNSDGTPDLSFGKEGRTNLFPNDSHDQWPNDMVAAPNGKILAGGFTTSFDGEDYWIRRYTANGRLDKNFAEDGVFMINLGNSGMGLTQLALQPDGKIVAAGTSSEDVNFHLKLFRLMPAGVLDSVFGTNGVINSPIGHVNQIGRLQIQSDGKIILPVYYYQDDTPHESFHLMRFNPNGTTDSEWGENGIVTTNINRSSGAVDCLLQPDGKLLACGFIVPYNGNSTMPAIARYHTGLDLRLIEPTESELKNFIYPNPVSDAAVLQYDLDEDATVSIQLFDLNGSRIQNFLTNEAESAGHYEQLLDVSNLASGNYFIEMTAGENHSMIKLVKQ